MCLGQVEKNNVLEIKSYRDKEDQLKGRKSVEVMEEIGSWVAMGAIFW